jgi:hypothetical protein
VTATALVELTGSEEINFNQLLFFRIVHEYAF